MIDRKKINPLPQEEIDKAVAGGQNGPEEPNEELCADHWCDETFKCDEPFSNYTPQTKEQNCFDLHGCDPEHNCSKPFTCSGDHIEGYPKE